jgi:hypothetical protein
MLTPMAPAPNFLRFCRSLALLTGPFIPISPIAIPTFVAGALVCGCSLTPDSGGGCYPDDADLAAGCIYCGCTRVDSGNEASSDANATDTTHDTEPAKDSAPADAADADSPDGVSLDSEDATPDGD